MALTESALVRMFDFTRLRHGSFNGWGDGTEEKKIQEELFYRQRSQGDASYIRGCQIVRSSDSKAAIHDRFPFGEEKNKQYASFVAQDWKNNVIAEISCDPKCLANYFTKSDLPFEITPAFFHPEVLLKYKSQPEKYELRERSITCKNAWHLKTYDINEAGQVHTYLGYLNHLPYEEQLYWKSFNEPPKAPISKRAYTSDMKGDVYREYNPLASLKQILRRLDETKVLWWHVRSTNLIEQVNYPATSSADEWASDLLSLDKLLIEGLDEKWLRKKAEALGRTPDVRLRALKLLEECLVGLGFEEDHAREIMTPFHEVHNLRSQMKSHANGEEASRIRASILTEYVTYRKHFEALCAECDQSIRKIVEVLAGS